MTNVIKAINVIDIIRTKISKVSYANKDADYQYPLYYFHGVSGNKKIGGDGRIRTSEGIAPLTP